MKLRRFWLDNANKNNLEESRQRSAAHRVWMRFWILRFNVATGVAWWLHCSGEWTFPILFLFLFIFDAGYEWNGRKVENRQLKSQTDDFWLSNFIQIYFWYFHSICSTSFHKYRHFSKKKKIKYVTVFGITHRICKTNVRLRRSEFSVRPDRFEFSNRHELN